MKLLRVFGFLFATTLVLGTVQFSFASELDREVGSVAAPAGLIVRLLPDGTTEVFRMSEKVAVDAATAESTIAKFAKAENRVEKVAGTGELDQVSSSEAWFYWYYPNAYYALGYAAGATLAAAANAWAGYSTYYPYGYTYYPYGYANSYANYAWTYYPYYGWYTPTARYYFYRYY